MSEIDEDAVLSDFEGEEETHLEGVEENEKVLQLLLKKYR